MSLVPVEYEMLSDTAVATKLMTYADLALDKSKPRWLRSDYKMRRAEGIRVLLDRGLSYSEVARRCGVTRGAIHMWLTWKDEG